MKILKAACLLAMFMLFAAPTSVTKRLIYKEDTDPGFGAASVLTSTGATMTVHKLNYSNLGGPWFDIREYGALDDNVAVTAKAAANWVALRAAYAAAVAAGGGTVYIPAGVFWVTAGDNGILAGEYPVVGGMYSAVEFRGEGRNSILRANAGGARFIDLKALSAPIRIRNLTFQGWLDIIHSTTGTGHWIDGMVEGCWFNDHYGSISTAKTTSALIVNNVFDVFQRNAITFKGGSAHVTVSNNLFYGSENAGYDCSGVLAGRGISIEGGVVDGATQVSHIIISNNHFYYSDIETGACTGTFRSIVIDGGQDVTVSGNHFSDISGWAITVGETEASRNVVIEGNTILKASTDSVKKDGIYIASANNFKIANNLVYQPGEIGIRVVGGVGEVIGNTVDGSIAGSGITADNVVQLTVIGNKSGNNLNSGFRLTGANKVQFTGNIVWNNDSGSSGGATDNDYSGLYINGGADINVSGNTIYVTGAGTFSQNLIQIVNSAARVMITGNYLHPYRTRPVYTDNWATTIQFDQQTNYFNSMKDLSADVGDAALTINTWTTEPVILYATELTANRAITCPAADARPGQRYRIVRTGLGAYTLDVCSLKTIASTTAAWVDVMFDGSAWKLIGYGAL